MKCPQCNHNQKYRDGMKCQKCGYLFRVDPKKYPGLSDARFAAIIKTLEQDGSTYYTTNQVYALASVKTTSVYDAIGCLILVAALVGFITGAYVVGLLLVAFFIAGRTALKRGILQQAESKRPNVHFIEAWGKWKANVQLTKLITDETKLLAPASAPEPDVFDYGVEGLLVVDKERYVDLLVKNGLHTEFKLMVISQSGYPGHLVEVANRLLSNRQDLPVFLLHNATTEPLAMVQQLSIQGQPIFDIGFSRADFESRLWLKPYAVHPELPVDILSLARIRGLLAYCVGRVQEMVTEGTLPVAAVGTGLLLTSIALDPLDRPPYTNAGSSTTSGSDDFG